ncbi:hypothetical protein [Nocardioides caricicola]|uniref:DUF4397 domain-containing protein n=1 Tax=Nocardioides caricicola TaxID=634770 RepID=A0ABW0N1S6_9ACTN
MAVVNIPPDNRIYGLGQVPGTMYVYNMNNPPGATTYNLTIVHVNAWVGVVINPGHSDDYPAGGNPTFIQNQGPSVLQVLYIGADEGVDPEAAGATVEESMPAVS